MTELPDDEGFEDIDDVDLPIEGEMIPEEQSGWAKALAWTILVVGGVYLLNPVAGVDLIPDFIPGVGNLDDAAIFLLTLGALHYLGMRLPEFIEQWIRPMPRLPASVDDKDQ